MSRDEAINYLISTGMSLEQIETVVNALSGKCDECPCFNVGYICGHNDAMCGGLDPILFGGDK
jgi:hypothetical protein